MPTLESAAQRSYSGPRRSARPLNPPIEPAALGSCTTGKATMTAHVESAPASDSEGGAARPAATAFSGALGADPAAGAGGGGPRRVIVVITEDHYVASPEGVFTRFGLDYGYWTQYLRVFDEVRPLARVQCVESADPSWRRSDGPRVCFAPIPFYQGIASLAKNLGRVRRAIRDGLRCDAPESDNSRYYYAMRGSGPLCVLAWRALRSARRPFARQIVGHDREGVHMGTTLRPAFLRDWIARGLYSVSRRMVREAATVAYVASHLRDAYPEAPGAPVFFFSDVNLDAALIARPRRADEFAADALRIVSVGRMNPEKGYDVLLDAAERLLAAGETRWSLEVVGVGPQLEALRARAAGGPLAGHVRFSGWVPLGPELYRRLDEGDLYVQPSLTEGTPRALLEAMARGLPALGSNVGGIPALVSADALLPAGDADAWAAALRGLIGQREELARRSKDCFDLAMRFHPDVMHARKREYWTTLREITDRRGAATGARGSA
ncbi:MAG: glycosyltransferase family 4 protein [Phycisphaerales bacterium]|nr:glycosyltransferase family 4 protein [Phycisphaerales bacterium]